MPDHASCSKGRGKRCTLQLQSTGGRSGCVPPLQANTQTKPGSAATRVELARSDNCTAQTVAEQPAAHPAAQAAGRSHPHRQSLGVRLHSFARCTLRDSDSSSDEAPANQTSPSKRRRIEQHFSTLPPRPQHPAAVQLHASRSQQIDVHTAQHRALQGGVHPGPLYPARVAAASSPAPPSWQPPSNHGTHRRPVSSNSPPTHHQPATSPPQQRPQPPASTRRSTSGEFVPNTPPGPPSDPKPQTLGSGLIHRAAVRQSATYNGAAAAGRPVSAAGQHAASHAVAAQQLLPRSISPALVHWSPANQPAAVSSQPGDGVQHVHAAGGRQLAAAAAGSGAPQRAEAAGSRPGSGSGGAGEWPIAGGNTAKDTPELWIDAGMRESVARREFAKHVSGDGMAADQSAQHGAGTDLDALCPAGPSADAPAPYHAAPIRSPIPPALQRAAPAFSLVHPALQHAAAASANLSKTSALPAAAVAPHLPPASPPRRPPPAVADVLTLMAARGSPPKRPCGSASPGQVARGGQDTAMAQGNAVGGSGTGGSKSSPMDVALAAVLMQAERDGYAKQGAAAQKSTEAAVLHARDQNHLPAGMAKAAVARLPLGNAGEPSCVAADHSGSTEHLVRQVEQGSKARLAGHMTAIEGLLGRDSPLLAQRLFSTPGRDEARAATVAGDVQQQQQQHSSPGMPAAGSAGATVTGAAVAPQAPNATALPAVPQHALTPFMYEAPSGVQAAAAAAAAKLQPMEVVPDPAHDTPQGSEGQHYPAANNSHIRHPQQAQAGVVSSAGASHVGAAGQPAKRQPLGHDAASSPDGGDKAGPLAVPQEQPLTALPRLHRLSVASRASSASPAGSLPSSAQQQQQEQADQDAGAAPTVPGYDLADYLQPQVVAAFEKAGARNKLYQWQVECLGQQGVLLGRNLVYAVPTGGGKSLVAQILMIHRYYRSNCRPCLVVLPFVALCDQMRKSLIRVMEPLHLKVKRFYGGEKDQDLFEKNTGAVVCTIEAANKLVAGMLENETLCQLGCVVVDELHLVGDPDRGYLLELMLTKLIYATTPCDGASLDEDEEEPPTQGLQIIGMSATLPNVADLAKWLKAAFYQTDFRPVPLVQLMKVGRELRDKDQMPVRILPEAGANDEDHIGALCRETTWAGHSVLIFCSSKAGCEITAREVVSVLGTIPERSAPQLGVPTQLGSQTGRAAFAERMRALNAKSTLAQVLPCGVVYHHAGLTSEERSVVEAAFASGAASVLCATSTMSTGVNLPARRVIFRTPYIAKDFLDAPRYRQMMGRAGRAGLDTEGESILICPKARPTDKDKVVQLMQAECSPIESCLTDDRLGMKRAVLEVVATRRVQTPAEAKRYVESTLLASTRDKKDVVFKAWQEAINWLGKKKLVRWVTNGPAPHDPKEGWFEPAPLGSAVAASGMTPEDALTVHADLVKARDKGVVFSGDLHLTYLVTPTTFEDREWWVDWRLLDRLLARLPKVLQQVYERVGVSIAFVHEMIGTGGKRKPRDEREVELDRICRRFYAALMLLDLIQEVPAHEVADKFGLRTKKTRGANKSEGESKLEGLMERAGQFAGRVATFCHTMGWTDMEQLIAHFQRRVNSGVKPEIFALVDLPYVRGARARLLYNAGLRSPEDVAAASLDTLENALKSGPSNQGNHVSARALAGKILRGAKALMQDRARSMREEARAKQALAERVSQQAAASGSGHSNPGAGTSQPGSETSQPAPEAAHPGGGLVLQPGAMPPVLPPPPPAVGPSNAGAAALTGAAGGAEARAGVPCNSISGQGAVLVEPGAQLASFCRAWSRQERYAFSLDFTPPQGRANALPDLPPLPPTVELDPGAHIKPAEGPRIHGIAVCWGEAAVYYLPAPKSGTNPSAWHEVLAVLASGAAEKVTFDLKPQLAALAAGDQGKKIAAELAGPLVDVRIVAWLLRPDASDVVEPEGPKRGNALENLMERRLGKSTALAAVKVMEDCTAFAGASDALQVRRMAASRKALMTWTLHHHLLPELQKEKLVEPLVRIEMPLVRVLADMEAAGLAFDPAIFDAGKLGMQRRMAELQAQVSRLAGQPCVLSEPKEVAALLWDRLKLPPPPGASKGRHGYFSTRAEVLEELAVATGNPVPALIQDYRRLRMLLAAFDGIRAEVGQPSPTSSSAPSSASPRGGRLKRIRGHFRQTNCATGRLAMDDPNLQCAPKEREYEAPATQAPPSGMPRQRSRKVARIRACFVAEAGRVLLGADYRQLELRLIAHFSRDEGLTRLLRDPAQDPFNNLAALWLKTPLSQVTEEQRGQAKALAYGLLYGMGAMTLAGKLGMGNRIREAEAVIASFRASLPTVDAWLTRVVVEARAAGYVRTLGGRRRYLPDLRLADNRLRAAAERQAVNTVCQGSAADLVKLAMIELHRRLAAELPKARLLLQVHDEVLLEVRKADLPAAVSIVRESMEGAVQLQVPLPVRVESGPSWGELQPFQP